MYLNQIYYGHGAYGAEAAAELYFGKHASELTLAESAMLAGIPKGPKYYSPYMDMKNAKDRQQTILQHDGGPRHHPAVRCRGRRLGDAAISAARHEQAGRHRAVFPRLCSLPRRR